MYKNYNEGNLLTNNDVIGEHITKHFERFFAIGREQPSNS